MKTVIVDILKTEAEELLENLEQRQLIRLRKEKNKEQSNIDWVNKYKGAMSKQPLDEINNQLQQLRNEWE